MHELAAKLAAAASLGDKAATLAAFADLGKNGCGGCHETYRKKKS
jgi:cytochrome c556